LASACASDLTLALGTSPANVTMPLVTLMSMFPMLETAAHVVRRFPLIRCTTMATTASTTRR
jgi:hypothetical protein